MEISVEVSQKTESTTTICFSYSTSRYMTEGIYISIQWRCLHTHVYCTIPNSQVMESDRISVTR